MKQLSNYIKIWQGLVVFLIAIFATLFSDQIPYVTDWMIQLLFALSIILHINFFNISADRRPIFNIEHLLTKLLISGVLVSIGIMLPDLLSVFNWPWLRNPISIFLIQSSTIYLSLAFLLYGFSLYKYLIEHRQREQNKTIWRAWVGCLMLLPLSQVDFPYIPPISPVIFWICGSIVALGLLKLKWVVALVQKTQWLTMFYFLGILLLCSILTQKHYYFHFAESFTTNKYLTILHPIFYPFSYLLGGFVVGYSLFSFLAVVFNYALSSIIEDQQAQLQSYQDINIALQKGEKVETVFEQVFNACKHNTYSEEGWLSLSLPNRESKIHHTPNIPESIITHITKTLQLEDIQQIDTNKGYRYFPDLMQYTLFTNEKLPFKSLLTVPILSSEKKIMGIICLIKAYKDGFDEYMINVVKNYTHQIKLALENAELLEQKYESERYKQELQIARQVQQNLMPKNFPATEFCAIDAFYESAKDVGGDYYDYNQFDDFRLGIIMGDVSGKGTSAAFHMAQMKGIFQSLMHLCLPPDNFLVMANQAAANCLEKDRFITLVYLLFDFELNTMVFSRAGHCPILFYSAMTGEVEFITGKGLGIGIMRNNSYVQFVEAHEKQLTVGDIIVLYTDGLIESRPEQGVEEYEQDEEYGYERLKNCLLTHAQESATTIKNAIYEDFQQYTVNSDYKDDTSLMVIKIKKLR